MAILEGVSQIFGEDVTQDLPHKHLEITESVRTRLPRLQGDGMISMELSKEPLWLKSIFPGSGCGVRVSELRHRWPSIADEIELSELREWERQNGFEEYTNCVRLEYIVRIRVGYGGGCINRLHRPYLQNSMPPIEPNG